MSDGIKTTLAVLGSVILVLFMVLCIGMCINGFRNKVYDVMNVVPEQQYNENEKVYTAQIEVYTQKIDDLNTAKQALVEKIANLDLTNSEQAKLLTEYEAQINSLNLQIVDLTKQLTEVSKVIGDSSIEYEGFYNHLSFAQFDIDGNYVYHGGYYESRENYYDMGSFLKDYFQNEYSSFADRIMQSASSNYDTHLTVYDLYRVKVKNLETTLDIFNKHISISSELTASTIVDFDGIEMTIEDCIAELQDNVNYCYNIDFEYEVNVHNVMTNLVCKITVMSN